jgi:hypothetical protein
VLSLAWPRIGMHSTKSPSQYCCNCKLLVSLSVGRGHFFGRTVVEVTDDVSTQYLRRSPPDLSSQTVVEVAMMSVHST